MKKVIILLFILILTAASLGVLSILPARHFTVLAEPAAADYAVGEFMTFFEFLQRQFADWERPEGPLRVGLQVGHWKADELPDELEHIRRRAGGTVGGEKHEWEVVFRIAEETAEILRSQGIIVDLLPATVSPSYWADAFISIHADGNSDTGVHGFRVAPPGLDITDRAEALSDSIETEYVSATSMHIHPNITDDMRWYYAFNWLRREHAIHPMTPAAIVETGFLTNIQDRRILIDNPKLPAEGIANGILRFLNEQQ